MWHYLGLGHTPSSCTECLVWSRSLLGTPAGQEPRGPAEGELPKPTRRARTMVS